MVLGQLPGGWCDVDISVEENTIKEVKEESGLDVTVKRVIAVQDREKHNLPIYAYKVCKIFMQCEVTGGQFKTNIEQQVLVILELMSFQNLQKKRIIKNKLRCVLMQCNQKNGKLYLIDFRFSKLTTSSLMSKNSVGRVLRRYFFVSLGVS